MRGLTMIEFMALMFTGLAGVASAVQAYVSYETRGEVARAIVFSERITACADLLSAIEPFRHKAAAENRARLAKGSPDARYTLAALYYAQSAGSVGFKQLHEPNVEAWRDAWARFSIVLPEEHRARGGFFAKAILEDIEDADYLDQAGMLAWLERFDTEAEAMTKACRDLVV